MIPFVLGLAVVILAADYRVQRFWVRYLGVGLLLAALAIVFDAGGMTRRVSTRYQATGQWEPAVRDGVFAMLGRVREAKPYFVFCIVGLALLAIPGRALAQPNEENRLGARKI